MGRISIQIAQQEPMLGDRRLPEKKGFHCPAVSSVAIPAIMAIGHSYVSGSVTPIIVCAVIVGAAFITSYVVSKLQEDPSD